MLLVSLPEVLDFSRLVGLDHFGGKLESVAYFFCQGHGSERWFPWFLFHLFGQSTNPKSKSGKASYRNCISTARVF